MTGCQPGTIAVHDADPDNWYAESDNQMCAAMKVFKFADRMFTNTARVHYKQARDGTRHYQRFSRLQENFSNNNKRRHLKAQLMERMESLGHSIKATKRCLADVQTEKAAKVDALQLCSWRLEQRNQRPPREQVHDGLEIALESEHDALMAVHDRLRSSEEQCVKALLKLDETLEGLATDPLLTKKKPAEQALTPKNGSKPETPTMLSQGENVGKQLLSFMNEERLTLKAIWQVMDDNGNGRTTIDEFTDGIRMLGTFVDEYNPERSSEACDALFNAIDEDMTGSLSWKELNQFFDDLLDKLRKTHPVGQALLAYLQEREWPLRQLWTYIDDGIDGRVELDEFLRGMDNAGFLSTEPNRDKAGCIQFFHAIDQDRTGVMSWHEFQSFFAELIKMTEEANKGRDFVRELAKKLAVANTMEREAKWMREESQDAIRTSSIDGGFSQRRIQAELRKKIQSTSGLKRRLEFLVSEAESRIRVHTWRATWRDHAEVVQVTKKERSGKKYFTDRPDKIAAAKELANVKDLEPLEVLEEALDALKADLIDKSAALAIDERCKYAQVVDGQVEVIVNGPPRDLRSPKNGHMGLALPAPNPARPAHSGGRAKSSPASARDNLGAYRSGKSAGQFKGGGGFGSSARADYSGSDCTPGPGLYTAEQSQAAWVTTRE